VAEGLCCRISKQECTVKLSSGPVSFSLAFRALRQLSRTKQESRGCQRQQQDDDDEMDGGLVGGCGVWSSIETRKDAGRDVVGRARGGGRCRSWSRCWRLFVVVEVDEVAVVVESWGACGYRLSSSSS
jgi:hypothetical protein